MKSIKSRKAQIAIVACGFLTVGVVTASATGVWKDPQNNVVSIQHHMQKFCDGVNLVYTMERTAESNTGVSTSDSFQVFRNVTDCGGKN